MSILHIGFKLHHINGRLAKNLDPWFQLPGVSGVIQQVRVSGKGLRKRSGVGTRTKSMPVMGGNAIKGIAYDIDDTNIGSAQFRKLYRNIL